MASSEKVLGQIHVTAYDTETELYKVPTSRRAEVMSIRVCELVNAACYYKMGVDVGDDNVGDMETLDFITGRLTLSAYQDEKPVDATNPLMLAAGDSINVVLEDAGQGTPGVTFFACGREF